MHYTISYHHPHRHFIDISLTINKINDEKIYLQLPAWRPGRYEVSNFAQNIRGFAISDSEGNPLLFRKVSKDRWEVDTNLIDTLIVRYDYYANKMDGGSTWLDETQLYINFINCMLDVEGRQDEPCIVDLQLPEDYTIACGLQKLNSHSLQAKNYYHLVDGPLIASNQLKHLWYEISESKFHLWIMGDWEPEADILLQQFQAFTQEQIKAMGEFPCTDYHFMFQILPYPHYHGVEHYNSTIIVLGPAEKLKEDALYKSMLGVSSHELFHTWNVIRIRPAEMMPYDFSKENYFKTGYVAEGVTTYYGDLFLVRSKVINKQTYFSGLNKLLKRHFDNFGRENLSVADSSYDVWLDGYVTGIPDRKSSIYIEGAVAAFILDLTIRKITDSMNSLEDVMRFLWKNYGKVKKGYLQEDYQKAAETIAGQSLQTYFDRYIDGNASTEEELQTLLPFVGCELIVENAATYTESLFGFKTIQSNNITIVSNIQPGAVADQFLTKDDELIAVNGRKIDNNLNEIIEGRKKVAISFFRNHLLKTVILQNNGKNYFQQRKIIQSVNVNSQQKENFEKWLGCHWE